MPQGIENLFVVKADADAQPVVRLAVSSRSLSIDALTRQIENDIIPELTAIEGVADINVFGERKRVLRVVIDPLRLAGYKLSVSDVVKVLQSADFDIPAGSFKSDEQEVLVRANTSVTKPSAIEQLVIRDPVRIRDIGHVFFSPVDAQPKVVRGSAFGPVVVRRRELVTWVDGHLVDWARESDLGAWVRRWWRGLPGRRPVALS